MDEPRNKKDLVAEILKCAKSPEYFLKSYGFIQHPIKGLIKFDTYAYQDDLLKAFSDHRFNIVLKSRQVGITTLVAGYIAWLAYFYQDKNILIVATKQEVAKNVIRIIRIIFKNLPKWFNLSKVSIDNKQSIELTNGSRVKATTTASDAGRSEALSLLIVDECAFIRTFSDVWVGLWPTLSRGGRAILASTPNGTGNMFHKLYHQSQNNENSFNCRFGTYVNPYKTEESFNDRLMWYVHPENDLKWFETETAGKAPRDIAQEYNCSFLASGDTFIFADDIIRVEKQVREPIERTNFDRNLWIWKYPEKGGVYLIGADVSRGDSKDFSGFHVLRLDTPELEQVAEYKGKITPDILGVLLVEVSKKYNNAIIALENNGGWAGQAVLRIRDLNHPFLYYTSRRKHDFIDPYYAQFADPRFLGDIAQPGYSITPLNRIPILAKMEQYVRQNLILLYSSRLIDEFRTFIWNNSKPEAQKGYHDDLVMSLAGGIWIREESFMNVRRGATNLNQIMLNGMSVEQTTTKQIPQFNFNQSGIYDRSRIVEFVQEQNKIVLGNGDSISMDWLLDPRKKISIG